MKPIIKSLYQYSRNEEIKNLIFDAFSKDWYTRYYAARNSRIPISILEKLSNDEDFDVCFLALSKIQNGKTGKP